MLQEAQLAAALLQVVVSSNFLVNGLVEALQVIAGRPNCPDLHDAPATSVPAVQNVPCSAPAFNTGFSLWISASASTLLPVPALAAPATLSKRILTLIALLRC